ncbi:uncharacterized protein DNG_07832 [Cephalotrichum gorgonifer]|uniref:Thioesterase domain-containing protein n=1 Tax=Cephalotrichum gorgonifer TaxID=2041049 RepID=A0AAE8SXS8_9PEZI|nr:uncharacterized protein DNG_07832 [Cephalotrichum gorgonifer]
MAAHTLAEQVAIDEAPGVDQFTSRANPGRMGNAANIAYGGCAIGVAIRAACETVPAKYLLYSAMGNYLGPALTDRKLLCSVRRLRDTRTFATRQVEVSQVLDSGERRVCMAILADFQVREKETMYEYSAPPTRKYAAAEASPDVSDVVAKLLPREKAKAFTVMYGMKDAFMETRVCTEGVAGQNLSGLVNVKTDQDHLPITSKTSASWTRIRHPISQTADKFAALGFVMDEALSFLPLTHTGKALYDVAACSSLDFALRFFTAEIDLSRWLFREWNTIAGGDGRTYTEARLWDREGKMVATMTQQSILRPKPGNVKASL